MDKLKSNGFYHIKVTNLVDKSVWDHRRVPSSDVYCLIMNKNLSVKVVKLVGYDEGNRRVTKK